MITDGATFSELDWASEREHVCSSLGDVKVIVLGITNGPTEGDALKTIAEDTAGKYMDYFSV
eukprot:CAMPEP_0115041814 /NCGR_PEP_ID=MMETSP0216-20121206/45856_1 /TAXON_ID=223996 /ORGANISM="Protocruzia adherens, Strain Boccale" /LENGTH=61 /DNA_ID=CAMNT_0002423733 /DNA_START=15 /DNA_END=196 /DNA_ORIENTATION=+